LSLLLDNDPFEEYRASSTSIHSGSPPLPEVPLSLLLDNGPFEEYRASPTSIHSGSPPLPYCGSSPAVLSVTPRGGAVVYLDARSRVAVNVGAENANLAGIADLFV
jgi:hypothetical protein